MNSVPGTPGDSAVLRPILGRPLDTQGAVALAEELRAGCGGSPETLAGQWGVRVRSGRLGAAAGGSQARMLPLPAGFEVTIDPEPAPGEPDDPAEAAARWRFRLAHELSHVLFFSKETPHVRVRRAEAGEETFCDLVAALLLVPPALTAGLDAAGLVALARSLRAPLSAAVMAASLANPPASAATGTWIGGGTRHLRRCGVKGRRGLSHAALTRFLTDHLRDAEGRFLVLVRAQEWSVACLGMPRTTSITV